MKKLLLSFLAFPLFLFSGCFGPSALDYHNDLVSIENELAEAAEKMEPVLTTAMTNSMTNGFDKTVYDESIVSLITSLDSLIVKTNRLGAYDGDESVQKPLLSSINAIKYLLESDIPLVFTALSENPENADTLMTSFIEKVGAIEKYDDDLKAALDAFDKKYEVEIK